MNDNLLINVDILPDILRGDYQFIDLRDPYEYKQLHLIKFINIPYNSFNNYLPNIKKNIPLYLICHTGKRSLYLANQLSKQGYDVYSVDGGFYTIKYHQNSINNNKDTLSPQTNSIINLKEV